MVRDYEILPPFPPTTEPTGFKLFFNYINESGVLRPMHLAKSIPVIHRALFNATTGRQGGRIGLLNDLRDSQLRQFWKLLPGMSGLVRTMYFQAGNALVVMPAEFVNFPIIRARVVLSALSGREIGVSAFCSRVAHAGFVGWATEAGQISKLEPIEFDVQCFYPPAPPFMHFLMFLQPNISGVADITYSVLPQMFIQPDPGSGNIEWNYNDYE